MRKLKVFEVVKLKDGDKATILATQANDYLAEIIDYEGNSKGTKTININEVKDIIISK